MTCIAWDGATLAGDRRRLFGDTPERTRKVARYDDVASGLDRLIGRSGDEDVAAELVAWLLGGAEADRFPPAAREKVATLLVVERGRPSFEVLRKPIPAPVRVLRYGSGPYPVEVLERRTAIGSGADYALGAMACGASAVVAVDIASQFDVHTGDGIDSVSFDEEPEGADEPEHPPEYAASA